MYWELHYTLSRRVRNSLYKEIDKAIGMDQLPLDPVPREDSWRRAVKKTAKTRRSSVNVENLKAEVIQEESVVGKLLLKDDDTIKAWGWENNYARDMFLMTVDSSFRWDQGSISSYLAKKLIDNAAAKMGAVQAKSRSVVFANRCDGSRLATAIDSACIPVYWEQQDESVADKLGIDTVLRHLDKECQHRRNEFDSYQFTSGCHEERLRQSTDDTIKKLTALVEIAKSAASKAEQQLQELKQIAGMRMAVQDHRSAYNEIFKIHQ